MTTMTDQRIDLEQAAMIFENARELDGKARRPVYVGRKASASPATGLLATHQKEQAEVVEWALAANIDDIPQPFLRPKKDLRKKD